mgnify:CR=1 FL=1
MGTGSRIIATEKLHEQGNMMSTENALDVAILGRGMFQILQADGTFAYTRDGSFKLNDQGQLVTANGQQLVPAVNIPNNAAAVTIGRDGTVSVELAGGGGSSQIGTIQVSRFINEAGLQPIGRNLYRETTASGPVGALLGVGKHPSISAHVWRRRRTAALLRRDGRTSAGVHI